MHLRLVADDTMPKMMILDSQGDLILSVGVEKDTIRVSTRKLANVLDYVNYMFFRDLEEVSTLTSMTIKRLS